ncbi:MAG: hypothetical protein GXN91_01310 [Epsilonproteobacteria bacterium]|nr:hypothetical protein [Campylobacterota bacterium]
MIIRLFFSAIFAALAFGIYLNLDNFIYKEKIEPNIDLELREKASKEYIEAQIREALANNRVEEAKEFIELGRSLNYTLDKNLTTAVENQSNSFQKRFNDLKDFATGFIMGEAKNGYSLAGSITSDFTLVGDIRDLYKEGGKYLNNEEYDKFILTLSIIGVGLSVTTITSLGASAPLKVGASVLKIAKRSKFLTKRFSRVLIIKLNRSVDLRILKRVDISSFNSIRRNSKAFINSINLAPIKPILKDVNTLYKQSSLMGSLRVLKYIDNEKELARAVKLSNRYKKQTPVVIKVLGKSALRGAKLVAKKSRYFFWAIGAIITFSLFSLYFLIRLFW